MGQLTRSGGRTERGQVSAELDIEQRGDTTSHRPPSAASVALVWLDAATAVVALWVDGPTIERLTSDVPSRHRSTGHLRHDPAVRHGGGGPATDLIDHDRAERRRAFVRQVAGHVPDQADVWILGPGGTREELAAWLESLDRRAGRSRTVTTQPSGRLTERQLVARLRELSGSAPRRRVVGRH